MRLSIDMRVKISFLRLLVAATVLAAVERSGVASLEIALPAAHAQLSGDLFRSSRVSLRSDKFFEDLFTSQNRKRHQRKLQRSSDNQRLSLQHRTKLKPGKNESTKSKKNNAGTVTAAVQNVPLPRPRPAFWPEPHSFVEAAGPDFNTADVTSASSDCNQRLVTIADIELLPRLIGPGDCGGRDMVRLNAVIAPDHGRVVIEPTAVLRCAMAESLAAWVRDEVSARINTLGTALRGIKTYGSYECRGRNGVPDSKLSEHGKGNAIDVRALILASDRHAELTDATVAKSLRAELRDSACHRFTTVLGPGADSYHNNHIHLDILERTHGSRICQWDVRGPPPPASKIAGAHLQLDTTSTPASARSLDAKTINNAQFDASVASKKGISALLIKAEILLARARFSPGEISGKPDENLNKAIAAFAEVQGKATDKLDQELWDKLVSISADPVVVDYAISEADLRGPFLEKIPNKMESMKGLPRLAYTGPKEQLAEKFHMSPELLSALNPGEKFEIGHTIVVANIPTKSLPEKVSRIKVDKTKQELRAFNAHGKLLAYYPSTVGSEEKPAPNGTLKITSVKKNPTYHYNPTYAFKGVRTKKPFTIEPGPNNPVGLVWIGLSGEGYGIHGTAEPGKVGKTQSHGCVRLTNWDALQLASNISKGISVDFIGEQKRRTKSQHKRHS
jgi:lipoprotein-anchoring transpeptidase ErfK/SrfK